MRPPRPQRSSLLPSPRSGERGDCLRHDDKTRLAYLTRFQHGVWIWMMCVSTAVATQGTEFTRVQEQGKSSVWVDRPDAKSISVKVSESITLAVRIEGDAPLVVNVEKTIPSDSWHLQTD